MSFQSLPYVKFDKKTMCGKTYTEYDGREGSFKAVCTKPKHHWGAHGQKGY